MADAATPLTDSNYALITQSKRKISNLIPNVVIEEIATDTLRVTDHPVEVGASISDHAFLLPSEIVMRCGWSDSTAREEGYTALQYFFLLALQAKREPFEVVTRHRIYKNMLISFLHKTADEKIADHSMMISVGMRNVILTNTSVTPSSMSQVGSIPIASSPTLPTFAAVDPTSALVVGEVLPLLLGQ